MEFNSTKELIYYLAKSESFSYNCDAGPYGSQEEYLSWEDKDLKKTIYDCNPKFEELVMTFFEEQELSSGDYFEADCFALFKIKEDKLHLGYCLSASEFLATEEEINDLDGDLDGPSGDYELSQEDLLPFDDNIKYTL